MRIACLAWGSLIWKAAPLRVASPWYDGGPVLPVEFARQSDGGELATVLTPGSPVRETRWAFLAAERLALAIDELREREAIPPDRDDGIGVVPHAGPPGPFDRTIDAWRQGRPIDAVVWTALPPRFAGVEGRVPTADEAVGYLASLRGDVGDHAEDYVRRVPPEWRTPYRTVIEERLGWTARDR